MNKGHRLRTIKFINKYYKVWPLGWNSILLKNSAFFPTPNGCTRFAVEQAKLQMFKLGENPQSETKNEVPSKAAMNFWLSLPQLKSSKG
jgi:hypothetical protein